MNSQIRWVMAVGIVSVIVLLLNQVLFTATLQGLIRWESLAAAFVVGALVVLAWRHYQRWQIGLLATIGGWLILAPSFLHFVQGSAPMWTHEVAGAGLLAAALSTIFGAETYDRAEPSDR